jgi:hypothetical protein
VSPAAQRDHEKRQEHDTYGEGQDYDFAQLVMETYGRLGRSAMAVLNALAEVAAANGLVSKAGSVRGALRELVVALCRGSAFMRCVRMTVGADGRARLSARPACSHRGREP